MELQGPDVTVHHEDSLRGSNKSAMSPETPDQKGQTLGNRFSDRRAGMTAHRLINKDDRYYPN